MENITNNTAKNLKFAFLHESQMRCLYEIFAQRASKEGYNLISNFFEDMSDNKQQNAYWSYIMLQNLDKKQNIEESSVIFEDIPSIGNTSENLKTAMKMEDYEWRIMYTDFAKNAKEEGLNEITSRFQTISDRERQFFERFKIFSELFDEKKLLKNESVVVWECQGCGFQIHKQNLPENWVCPSCGHMKSYFQKKFLNLSQGETNTWVCMECGEEYVMDELPKDWKCLNCGKSREYFRRKKAESISDDIFSLPETIWECMECGNEVRMRELPEDWKCISCGKPKSYFKRKSTTSHNRSYSFEKREKAIWYCPSCGREIEIDLPDDWKCPVCGSKVY